MPALPRLLCLGLLALLLAACGGNPRNVPGIPDQFGDAVPHDWGRRNPAQYDVHGIDMARYQTGVDWPAVASSSVSFAFIKATEGGDYVDPMLHTHLAGARSVGIPVGAYHYYYFCRTPEEQAYWFIRNVPRMPRMLPPVLDMEWTPTSRTCTRRPDPATVQQNIRVFSAIIDQFYGQPPVIYTTVDFYRDNRMGSLRGYDFWLRSTAGHPSQVYPGQDWTFWQYTSTGLIRGIPGQVDINAFNGNARDWARWLARRMHH